MGNETPPETYNANILNTKSPDSFQDSANESLRSSVSSLTSRYHKVSFVWENVNVQVIPSNSKIFSKNLESPKQIINNVSGFLESGQMLSIMGASGAGKSTLLDVLACRNRGSLHVDGHIFLNGQTMDISTRSVIAYVQQDDLFLEELTVREHLTFQAMLKLSRKYPLSYKTDRVNDVILELGLTKCQNTKIGSASFRGISGGERKRLAFASELLTDPPIMFCDEPTTGMDSFMAENIVLILKQLANRGRAIIFTIHQPSSHVFSIFDRLLLLAEGRTAFFGSAYMALDFFEQSSYPCPNDFNPADFFVYTLSIKQCEEKCRGRVKDICDKFVKSSYFQDIQIHIQNKSNMEIDHVKNLTIQRSMRCRAKWCTQFRWLLWRASLGTFRNPILFYSHISQKLFLSVLYGLVFLQQTLDQEGVSNISGALFCLMLDCSFPSVYRILDTFYQEISLFIRENQNGIYRTDAYYLAKIVAWIPLFTLDSLIMGTIAYWMIGFSNSVLKFFTSMFIFILTCNVASSFGAFLSTSCPSLSIALAISSPVVVMFSIVGGYYINVNSIPIYMRGLEYIAWIRYSTEALNIIQWNDITNITCNDLDISLCLHSGEHVLKEFSFYPENFYFDILVLCLLFAGFHILAFLFLLRFAYKK